MSIDRAASTHAAAAALLRATGGLVPALRALLAAHGATEVSRRSRGEPTNGNAARPPTPKQVSFLKNLRHPAPDAVRTSREADAEIKRLLAGQGGHQ